MTIIDKIDKIAVVSLKNPPGNCLTAPDFMDKKTLEAFLTQNKIKALIIKGAGKHFSAGAEVSAIYKQVAAQTLASKITKGKELLKSIYDLNIPVIAAIEGVCFGGGLEIALSAHIRIVSQKALLAFPESIHQLMPGLGGTCKLKNFVTLGKSIEILLQGNTLNAEKALELGLADYICNPGKSYETAVALAENLTKGNSMMLINNVMKALKNAYEMPLHKALEKETLLFCELASVQAMKKNNKE